MKIGDSHLKICPHCGNHTPHKLVFSHSYKGTWYGSDGKASTDESNPISTDTIFECATCHDISLYSTHEYQDEAPTLMYPKSAELDKSVPQSIANNYREAKTVQNISPNAFAVLIRRALEALCDDRAVPAGRLQQRLEQLAHKGEIPPILAEITSVLRTLGNSGAHNTNQNVTVPMTWKMDDFFRALIEYVYIAPSKLAEFREKITGDHEEN